MTDWIGQQLGNYRLRWRLGSGGFAEVYLGEHVYLGTQAAIKVLRMQLSTEEVERFFAEARTIARLKHPHIVRVLEFGVERGVPYLVMDYAPGGTLRSRCPRGTPHAPELLLPAVQQVASALQYAHDQHLIHRDVKPENMLVAEGGEVLLSDFGIALLAQSTSYQQTHQSTREVVGTLVYMAPEQIQRHPRPASDQYALGVVIYEWLTGARLFTGSMSEVVAKHLGMRPPPLREQVPGLSPAIERVMHTALEKEPSARYPSVQAFADAFEQAVEEDHAPRVWAGGPRMPTAQPESPRPLMKTRAREPAFAQDRLPVADRSATWSASPSGTSVRARSFQRAPANAPVGASKSAALPVRLWHLALLLVVVVSLVGGGLLAARLARKPSASAARQTATLPTAGSTVLPDTSARLGFGMPHDYHTTQASDETGHVDFVWASDYNYAAPDGVFRTLAKEFARDQNPANYPNAHTLAWFQANHPDWIEYQCDQKTVAFQFGQFDNVPLDFTNPAVLSYLETSEYSAGLSGRSTYQGLGFASVALFSYGHSCGHFTSTGAWVQQFTGTSDDPAYRAAVITWAKTIHTWLHSAFPGRLLVILSTFDPQFPADEEALVANVDVLVDNTIFTHEGDSPFIDSSWEAHLEYLSKAPALFMLNQLPVPYAQLTTDQVTWALANYLLVKGRASYFWIGGGSDSGTLLSPPRPEYRAARGTPTEPWHPNQGVYSRTYTKGLVLVNPSSTTSRTVTLPSGRWADLSGQQIIGGSVTLLPLTALILEER